MWKLKSIITKVHELEVFYGCKLKLFRTVTLEAIDCQTVVNLCGKGITITATKWLWLNLILCLANCISGATKLAYAAHVKIANHTRDVIDWYSIVLTIQIRIKLCSFKNALMLLKNALLMLYYFMLLSCVCNVIVTEKFSGFIGWIGLDWIGLDWIGLNWIGLDC